MLAYVPLSTKEDVDRAVQNSKEAFAVWSRTPVPRRARILFKYQQLLVDHWEELAQLVTKENGKSYTEAYGEVLRGIECVEFAAGAPNLMMGKQLPDIASNLESGMYRYPVGVVAGITPFNFPMMVPCWMFPLAIACGNTFVLKPSERTPLLANRLAELFQEAGLPEGVLNIVHGAHDVVNGSSSTRTFARYPSSAPSRSQSMCTKPHPLTANAFRRWQAPKTTRSSCRTPISI